jgi:hypothetical protein
VSEQPAGIDVAQLARDLDEHRAREKAEAQAAAARGGPCRYCGVQWSWKAPGIGEWQRDGAGLVCLACDADRRYFRARDAGIRPDLEHRATVLRDLLDLPAPWLDGYLVERSGFRWWSEVPDAPGGGDHRFAYVTTDEIMRRLYPSHPDTREPGPPCPRCGVADCWLTTERYVPGYEDAQGNWSSDPARWPRVESERVCQACRTMPANVDDHAAALVGLALGTQGCAAKLGVSWHADRPRPRRRATRPLDWWPPLPELRARAWQAYGQKPGEWYRAAEGRWRSGAAMRRAEADAKRAAS